MDKKEKKEEIIRYFTSDLKRLFESFDDHFWNKLISVRISVDSPLIVELETGRMYLGEDGITMRSDKAYRISKQQINNIFELVTKSSIYAYGKYVNDGYVTLSGGNRVGIVGDCTVTDGKITAVSEIYSMNFRIAHEKIGVSDSIIKHIFSDGKIFNTLIVSPPACGKTTILRDVARNLGTFKSFNKIFVCALIDERYELAGTRGRNRNLDIGENNFVVSGCSKMSGIYIATRSMAPDVIIVDEICSETDYKAALYARNSGVSIIASVHGKDETINEVNEICKNNIFEKIIVLSFKNGPGTIEKITGV